MVVMNQKAQHAKSEIPLCLVLQPFKNHYATAADHRTYRLSNQYSRYDETVFSYIDKSVKK